MDRWTFAFVACLTISVLGAGLAPSQALTGASASQNSWPSLSVRTPVTP